jgi:hypothetical protein
VFLFAALLASARASQAQETATELSPQRPAIVAVRTPEPVEIDGVFAESAWSLAAAATEFLQKDPNEGAAASERTEVRILFDTGNLYIGVHCYDSQPGGIRATELRRDNEFDSDDIFEIILDPLHDHRNGYLFRVNPLGTLFDSAVSNEGQSWNDNWNERWEAATRVTEEGWFAEIRIPFSAVRFSSGQQLTWGVNFHRSVRRKNEDVFWTAHNRNYEFGQVSRAGHLEGLSDIRSFRARVKPFVTAGGSRVLQEDGLYEADHLTDGGIEDAKFLLTPQLALDVTVNPDFAQADVDQAEVNLTRFSTFFPERREFFQEGAGIFETTTSGNFFGPELLLFHSRRIGLSEDREEIPIYGGLKLTGKQGPLDIGLLNMQTRRSPDGLAGQNFAVARIKANVLARSYLGFLATRNTAGATGPSNWVGAFDAGFLFLDNMELEAMMARNDAPGTDQEEWAGQVEIEWESDRWNLSVSHVTIQENFLPQMGFVSRAEEGWKGVQHSNVGGSYSPRPDFAGVRQFDLSAFVDYFANQEGLLDAREFELGWGADFESGDGLTIEYSRNFERLLRPQRFRSGEEIVATLTPADYSWWDVRTMLDTFEGRPVSASFALELGEFYSGRAANIDVGAEFRPTPNLSFEPSMEWSRISLPGAPAFSTKELNTELNYSFNQQWLTRSTFLLNSQDKEYTFNFRLNYIYRPENDLFIVYNETRAYGAGRALLNRALIVKLTYSIDF